MNPPNNFVRFLGFAPDADPTTPGVLTDTTFMIAGVRSLQAFPGVTRMDGPAGVGGNANFSAYPQGIPEGMWIGLLIGTSGGAYVKTSTTAVEKLYALKLYGSTTATQFFHNWEDITPTDMTMARGPHVFAKMGDVVLCAGGEPITSSLSPGDRSRLMVIDYGTVASQITASPRSCVVAVASRFALAFNYTDSTARYDDGWYCSARDNYADWTPSPSTLCAFGRLVESDGPITAAIGFGDDIVACKINSMYLGRFVVGSAEVWEFEKISNSAGARNQLCVCSDREGRVYMLGVDDLYVWDGAQVKNLMGGVVRQWFLSVAYKDPTTGSPNASPAQIIFDPVREVLIINVYASNSWNKSYVVTYCPRSKLWAKHESTANELYAIGQSGLQVWPAKPALFGMQTSSTYGNTTANRYLVEFNVNVTAGAQVCGFTTGDFGDDYFESELKTVRVRDIAGNVSYTNRLARGYHRQVLTESLTAGPVSTAKADGAFDIRQSDKWHRLRFEYSGHAEITGINLDITKQGAK